MTDLKPSNLDLAAAIEEKPSVIKHVLLHAGSPNPSILLIAQDASLIGPLKECKTWQTDNLLAFGGLKQLQQGTSDNHRAETPLLAPCPIAYAGDGIRVTKSCQAGQILHVEMPALLSRVICLTPEDRQRCW